MNGSRIRVLCVDDHPIFLQGVSLIIGLQNDMELVATASTGDEAIAQFRHHKPDVTLMDLRLPTLGGLDVIERIRRDTPDARIVVLSMYDGDEDVRRALDAGASSYILKSMGTEAVVGAVRLAHSGASALPGEVAERLTVHESAPRLSARELQVLELIGRGVRNKDIANGLHISEDTVHVHVKHICLKLGVNDRVAAISVALKRGIIHVD